jgi:hypothetical protein
MADLIVAKLSSTRMREEASFATSVPVTPMVVRYLLASNVGEILVMLFAMLLALPLPLVPIQILMADLIVAKLSSTRMREEASFATSVPVTPMATPI